MTENKKIITSRSDSNSNSNNYNNNTISNNNDTGYDKFNKPFKEFNTSISSDSSRKNTKSFSQNFKTNSSVSSNFKTDAKIDSNNELYFDNMFNEFKEKMQLLSNDILNKVNCIEDSLNELEEITTELQKNQ